VKQGSRNSLDHCRSDGSTEASDFCLDQFLQILESRYRAVLLRKATGILRDIDLAETALSDTWLHIAKYWKIQAKLYAFVVGEDVAGLGRYLGTIVKGRALNLYSKRKNMFDKYRVHGVNFIPYDSEILDLLAISRENPEDQVIRSEAIAEVVSFLSARPADKNCEALRLHIGGWSYGEIAGKMGVSIGTVRSYIHRARKQYVGSMPMG